MMPQEIPRGPEHIRHVMLYEYLKGSNPKEARDNIRKVYGDGDGDDVTSLKTLKRWFERFHSGDFNLKDKARRGRPVRFDEESLLGELEKECSLSIDELSSRIGFPRCTVHFHLKKLGKVSKLGKWVPHELSEGEGNKAKRVQISS